MPRVRNIQREPRSIPVDVWPQCRHNSLYLCSRHISGCRVPELFCGRARKMLNWQLQQQGLRDVFELGQGQTSIVLLVGVAADLTPAGAIPPGALRDTGCTTYAVRTLCVVLPLF
jgi:hypothetical protein